MKTQIQLPIPILLNKLYIPVIKYVNGKPTPGIRKNPEAKKYQDLVKIYAIKQKTKLIKGKVSFKMDILINKRKDYDIDAVEKLALDSLEGIAYTNDKNIVEKISRKHLESKDDKLIIEIEELK
ncbi:RusA family crossover junction endodeoxyribonuclease [Brevundimonas sp. FT23028]|uniref:RusA family crossover junction endodeoxyribonuclease n=1 Tax=Brevundimonas sp. FT23028 TaxID=3393748 RepID=UPI003B589DE5